jgi:hypothetical protein
MAFFCYHLGLSENVTTTIGAFMAAKITGHPSPAELIRNSKQQADNKLKNITLVARVKEIVQVVLSYLMILVLTASFLSRHVLIVTGPLSSVVCIAYTTIIIFTLLRMYLNHKAIIL